MRWTLAACLAIVAFDAVTAAAARSMNTDYGGLPGIIGSTAIYAFPAVMAVRDGYRVRVAALAGASVALVDATIGWAVSWIIGPGAPPPDGRNPAALVLTAITVVVIGAAAGLLAGLVTRRVVRKLPTRGAKD